MEVYKKGNILNGFQEGKTNSFRSSAIRFTCTLVKGFCSNKSYVMIFNKLTGI